MASVRRRLPPLRRFSDEGWARRAADLGWDEVALFGCSPINPLGYLGIAGLLWNVAGGRIIRLRADGADIRASRPRSCAARSRLTSSVLSAPEARAATRTRSCSRIASGIHRLTERALA